jgi:hypothetical protein
MHVSNCHILIIKQGSYMNRISNQIHSTYREFDAIHDRELPPSQANDENTDKLGSFNVKAIDVEPIIPTETVQKTGEAPHTSSFLQTSKKTQSDLVGDFVTELLFHLQETAVNPDDINTSSFIPCIADSKFFTVISPIISKLVRSTDENNFILNEVIDNIISSFVNCELSSSRVNMCSSLLNSVKSYEQQKKQLGRFWGLGDTEYNKYLQNIYKLFIEGDKLYPSLDSFEKDINDLGPYIFENETSYLSCCLSAISCTTEQLVIKNKPLSTRLINEMMGIFGSYIKEKGISSYRSIFSKDDTKEFVSLLSQGKIARYLLLDNCTVKSFCGIAFIESHINSSISDNTKVKLKQSEEDPDYYVIDTITETKNGAIEVISSEDALEKQPCVFEIEYFIKKLTMKISFDRKYNKAEYINYLVTSFNNETAKEQTDLEYAISVIKLGGALQRAHVYTDANGRGTFFNIVIVLLIKRGLFPTRQPFNLWKLIDAVSPEILAKKYLEQCIKAPNIQHDDNYHWLDVLPASEKLRIACIIGNKSIIKKILNSAPELLFNHVQNIGTKKAKYPLTIMEKYGHHNLIQYTLLHPKFKQQAKINPAFNFVFRYYNQCSVS